MPIPLDEFAELAITLENHNWIFAKTMPQNPHWYTLRKQWDSDSKFVETVKTIRRFGYKAMYKGRAYIQIDVNDMFYWTMGDTLDRTILINRKRLEQPAPYDEIAARYDGLFNGAESLAENDLVIAMLPDTTGKRVLDIGCGTGFFLDYRNGCNYTGIDPSQPMLSMLKMKHPEANTVQAKFEDFWRGKFDLITALFAAGSYVEPWALQRIPKTLNEGGQYFLMFYRPDYYPVTYESTGVEVPHHSGNHLVIDGEMETLGNFIIVQGSV